jgi:hypothetical protein
MLPHFVASCCVNYYKKVKRSSRPPHFLDNEFTDGGEVVSLTRRSHVTPRKIPRTHFYYRLIRLQGHSAAGRVR